MKSLEALKQLKDKHITSVTRRYYESGMPKFRRDEFYKMYDEELELIKQDLEVLEILKNLFKNDSREYKGNNFGVMANGVELYMRNREDYNKVKQWLEEQE